MNDAELFAQVRAMIREGWQTMPSNYGGTGAPGRHLEYRLGLKTSSSDTPDAGRWELKFCSGSSLLTLFHKSPRPQGCMRYMVNLFGWIGRNGRQSFRHTIAGRSDQGFEIVSDSGSIWVRHADHAGPVPHWTEDDLLNAVGGKLRRLLVVHGERRGNQVRYNRAVAYSEFRLSGFVKSLTSGLIAVDFDATIKENGAVRDHGTKFRVKPNDIQKLYQNKVQL